MLLGTNDERYFFIKTNYSSFIFRDRILFCPFFIRRKEKYISGTNIDNKLTLVFQI